MQEIGRFLRRLLNPESPSDSPLSQPPTEPTASDLTTPPSSAVDIINQSLESQQQKREAARQAEAARKLAEEQRQHARDEQAIQAAEKELEKQRIRVQEKQRVLQQSGVTAELEKIRNELKPDASIRTKEQSISLTWTVTFDKEITRTIYHAEQTPFNRPAHHEEVGTGRFIEVTEEYGIKVSPYAKGQSIERYVGREEAQSMEFPNDTYMITGEGYERSVLLAAAKDLLEISVMGTTEYPNHYTGIYTLDQPAQKLAKRLARCYLAADANQRGVYLS